MAKLAKYAFIGGKYVTHRQAKVSVASSAVLYGLSIYTVFFLKDLGKDGYTAFRLEDHFQRLRYSARILGMDTISKKYSYEDFVGIMQGLVEKNKFKGDYFFRVTIHVVEEVPGVRTSGVRLDMSVFAYEAENILPQFGAHIKTSLWRRTADNAIPARAKVNGAYVNSALAKQEAIDAGADDALFLNQHGHVSELSAANIFIVRAGKLITPDVSSDILEGITRKSIMAIAKESGIEVVERKVALTEVYTADEVFACGTSAFVAPITKIDHRVIGNGEIGDLTVKFRDRLTEIYADAQHIWITDLTPGENPDSADSEDKSKALTDAQ